ncbi:MAG: hypothetical protein PVF73_07315 [Bacteroidales bacterium]|jgi:hypothetical protein
MVRKILLLFLFTILLPDAFAQTDFREGYVILGSGDTLTGEIDFRGDIRMSMVCRFRPTEEDNPVIYSPSDIKAFRFADGKYYVSKEIIRDSVNKKVFLEFLIKGKLNVYYLSTGPTEESYFIEKEGMPLAELPYNESVEKIDGKLVLRQSKKHIGILMYYMGDDPKIKPQIQDLEEPDHNKLIKLAENYHSHVCKDEECIVYEKKLHLISFAIEPVGGVITYPSTGIDRSITTYETGILIYSWLPRSNEKLYVRTGLLYHPLTELADNIYALRIPMQLQYLFPERLIRPKFFIGLHVLLTKDEAVFSKYHHSLTAGAGANIKIYKRIDFSLSVEADFTPLATQIRGDTSFGLVSYSITGGLYFPLYKE